MTGGGSRRYRLLLRLAGAALLWERLAKNLAGDRGCRGFRERRKKEQVTTDTKK
jgi:hypothetical protein